MAKMSRNYCALSAETRRHLRKHREELGLSLMQLGALLHIDWSTIRNWENGRTVNCYPANLRRISGFIAGEYDALLPEAENRTGSAAEGHGAGKSPMLDYCAERISNTCRLCAEREDIRNQLVRDINFSVAKALRLMLE